MVYKAKPPRGIDWIILICQQMLMFMGFIYCITNKINNKKYIGKTVYSVEKRFKEHCYDCIKERCEKRPLYDAMLKYGIENFSVETIAECDNEELAKLEIFYIEKYDTYGKNGYNATRGGDGSILFNHQKIIDDYLSGLTMKQVAELHHCCCDTVSKILKQNHVQKHNNGKIPIDQYSLSDEYIASFESILSAFLWVKENGYSNSKGRDGKTLISKCLHGDRKSAYGFIWKYHVICDLE